MVTIAVELSTNITNEIDAERVVMLAGIAESELGYDVGGIVVTAVELNAQGAADGDSANGYDIRRR